MTEIITTLVLGEFAFEIFIIDFILLYRKATRKYAFPTLLSVLALSIALLQFRRIIPANDIGLVFSSLLYFADYLIVTIGFFLAYKLPLANVISLSTIGYCLQHIGYSIVQILTCLIPTLNMSLGVYYFMFSFGTILIFYASVYFLFLRRMMTQEDSPISLKRIILSSLLLYIITSVINLVMTQTEAAPLALICIRLLAIFSCLFVINLQRSYALVGTKEKENNVLTTLIQNEQAHQRMSEESINIINIKVHDLKKLINSLTTAEDEKSRKEIALETDKALKEYSSIAHTQNKTLDNILFEKNLICLNRNIHLVAICDGRHLSFMNPIDLYSLVTNLLDNAIEAVSQLAESERSIRLRIITKNDRIQIEVSNPYKGKVVRQKDSFLSSKADKINHGFGLKSVQFLVEKYHGNMVVEAESDTFTVLIVMPLD